MSESSSEDENQARLREAVWRVEPRDVMIQSKDGVNNERPSRRVDVSKHEHDGNELGTTPEFQSHVAKKLGAILDGCISEVFSEAVDCCQSKKRDEEESEEGFRLFSTSTAGKWEEQSPPPPKRRPIPSSSDSDSEMEMRLREAAVSVADILGPLAQSFPEKTEGNGTTKTESGKEDTVTKKKKKRKTSTEGRVEESIHVSQKPSNGEGTDVQKTVEENVKKKKKKRKKLEGRKVDN